MPTIKRSKKNTKITESSENIEFKKKLSRKSNRVGSIPKRVNILFFVIFILFMILIVKLYNMQVQNQKFYADKLSGVGANVKIIQGAPRGNIYDAAGQPLATTTAVEAVKFTRGQNASAVEMRTVADQLSTLISASSSTTSLTTRDKKDYYLADAAHLKKINEKLTPKEKKDKQGNNLSGSKIYAVQLSKVSEKELNFTPEQTFAAQLFKKMNGTSTFHTTIIAIGDITAEQQAAIAEREGSLPGISISTSWDRSYANNSLTTLVGTVSSQQAGLPAEDAAAYLKKGYQPNDRVGTSYLEKGYEEYLQGTHQISKVVIDKSGNVTGTKVVQEGKKGDDIKLTVDLNFQTQVDNIVKTQLQTAVAQGFARYSDGAYAVVMNPKTGAVLAMSGFKRDPESGVVTPSTYNTFGQTFLPGSVVKPATLSSGWSIGAINGNQTFTAQAINIKGSNAIKDVWGDTNPFALTAAQALQYSSNTYMTQVALAMLGQSYTPGMSLSSSKASSTWAAYRKIYGQYGLGTNVGFDIPGSTTGFLGADTTATNALFEAFGQYDQFSPLQLAVYASTIANGGTRITPHIVQGVYDSTGDGEMGKLIKKIETKTMDKVDISASNMQVIHDGMYAVTHGTDDLTTGRRIQNGVTQDISGKTGTAETYAVDAQGRTLYAGDGKTTIKTTVSNTISFAPSANPDIAVAVMVPHTSTVNGATAGVGQLIANEIYKLYFGNPTFQNENNATN
ncbi:MAG: penicillin-binding protein 2 [Lactococcus hircilactis]|uniref:peptidoglycan D,D-transpeptidase FtsI family protein n=1 Tax=Lactococcus hircilactis TaxID=1494462 RepID=UPI003BE75B68